MFIRPHAPALLASALVFSVLPASTASAVVIDLTQRSGAFSTTGERLEQPQTAVATTGVYESDDDIAGTPLFSTTLTVGGDTPVDLRITGDAMGINSAQPNSADSTLLLDETADGVTPETLSFTFTTDLSITRIGLSGFGSHVTGGETYQEALSINFNGTTFTFAADSSGITTGQTVAGDSGISVLVLPAPITLIAGQSITFGVATDGDGSFAGTDRSNFGLHSIEVAVPEPGSLALALSGAGLILFRRR